MIELSKAKIGLMSHKAGTFFSSILFNLELVETTEVPTAATNGKCIKINPDFFLGLTKSERIFLLAHEVSHVAYLHMLRTGNRNTRKFNAACDYVINLQLVEAGFQCPPGGLLDSKYSGMSAEQVYALLPEDAEPDHDDLMASEDPREALQEEIDNLLVQGYLEARKASQIGSIPSGLLTHIENLVNPKLPWQVILRNYVDEKIKDNHTWNKPNRRFDTLYLPTRESESLDHIQVFIDTSASVEQEELDTFISEIKSLSTEFDCTVDIISFDTSIKEVIHLEQDFDPSEVKLYGRGGTFIEPVWEYAENNPTHVSIIFTDGGFNLSKRNTSGDFIWIIYNNTDFSFEDDEVIYYE